MKASAERRRFAPESSHGQGWVQLTDQGKIYLSKKESNVFIVEGTGAAGFSACAYSGKLEETSIVDAGSYQLTTELKCMPSDLCPDQQVLVLFDCSCVSELSSGCDFCGVHLGFDTREVRIETHRPNTAKQTLFAQPNCAVLRPSTYVAVLVNVSNGSLSLSLNGVSLISNLPFAFYFAQDAVRQVGVAVYGKSRCYLRRFKLSPGHPSTPACRGSRGVEQGSPILQSASLAPVGQRGSATRRSSSSSLNVMTATAHGLPGPPLGAGPGQVPSGNGMASDEMELSAMIERDVVVDDLNVRFDDIGGLEDAKRAINEAVLLPLLIPEFFTGIRRPWKGVLLFGPPGTGKTMLAKAVASCAENVTFFNCSSATLTSKWRGESEKLLRALFTTARSRVPSILFFDEIDSLLSHRGGSIEHEASRRFKSEFLIHMDGLLSEFRPDAEQSGHLLVLATSNAPWDLDDALRRRLEKRIHIPLPDEAARLKMFQHYVKGITCADDVDLAMCAARTEGYSGADVQLLVRDASMNPMRRLVDGLSPMELVQLRNEGRLSPTNLLVESADLISALANVQPSVSSGDTQRFFQWEQEFGSK